MPAISAKKLAPARGDAESATQTLGDLQRRRRSRPWRALQGKTSSRVNAAIRIAFAAELRHSLEPMIGRSICAAAVMAFALGCGTDPDLPNGGQGGQATET